MIKNLIDEKSRTLKRTEAMYAALIGLNAIAVIQLLQVAIFDTPLKVALYCFAISIPVLTATLLVSWIKPEFEFGGHVWLEGLASTIGIFGSVVGLGAIFWHFSRGVGITFIISVLVALVILQKWQAKMKIVVKRLYKVIPYRILDEDPTDNSN